MIDRMVNFLNARVFATAWTEYIYDFNIKIKKGI